MAYLNPIRYNNLSSVDVRFAPILEKNLWKDVTFVPNVSFTTKYQIRAGQIYVRASRKVTVKEASAEAVDSGTGGGLDFLHTHTADDLIPIYVDRVFSASEKVYEAVEQARESATGAQTMEVVINSVKEKFQAHAMGVLANEGIPSSVTTETGADDTRANILAARKALRDVGANPDILITSTKVYSYLLAVQGKEFFPNSNEEILRTGAVGKYFGINVYESNLITDTGGSGHVEFIMYDHEAFSIVYVLDTVRMVDAGKDFVGAYAQAQIVAGFKVTLPDGVIVKRIGAIGPHTVTFVLNDGKYFDEDGKMKADSGEGYLATDFTTVTNLTQSIAHGKKVNLTTAATALETAAQQTVNLEFIGWFYDNPADGVAANLKFKGNRPIRDNLTLYARFRNSTNDD